jgi:putative permease
VRRNKTLYSIISARKSWIDAALVCAIVIAVAFLLYRLGSILLPFVAACLAAYVLTPIVELLERRGLSRHAAVACLYGLFVVLISGIVVFVIPTLEREIRTLHIELPRYSNQINHALMLLQGKLEREFPILTQVNLAERVMQASVAYLAAMRERFPLDAFMVVSSLLFVPFFTWYLLLEGTAIKKFLISCLPNAYFETTLNLIYRIDQHLSRYLFGQLINLVCISFLSAMAYSLIGVEFGIAIGILNGVGTLIPYIGPIVGASAAVLVSVLGESSVSKMISIILASSAIYAFDHLVVKTVVISKTTDLHPVTIVSILIIGGHMFGLWGLLFGIPIFCIAKIFFQEFTGVLQRRRPGPMLPKTVQPTSY